MFTTFLPFSFSFSSLGTLRRPATQRMEFAQRDALPDARRAILWVRCYREDSLSIGCYTQNRLANKTLLLLFYLFVNIIIILLFSYH